MIRLRDYQAAAVDSMLDYWANGGGHGLIVIPTGGGKSLVAAELVRRLYEEHGARILLASHVAELITQNAKKLVEIWPEAPFGIYHAGLGKRDSSAPIVYAGIHSIFRTPEILGDRHVVLIDEAHLLSHKDTGMYRALIRHLDARVPGMRVGGLTATPYRLSTGRLDEDYGDHKALFSDVAYEVSILKLIQDGWLCPVLPYVSPEKVDMAGVRTSAGEYNQKDIQAVFDKDDVNVRIVDGIVYAGQSRGMWLVFATGVAHAQHLTQLFREREIAATCIVEETSEQDRKEAFKSARNGTLRCLVGVNTLTTGVDIPNIDLIACVRPTKSKGLWTQMVGRGTRLSPETGKENCLLLDFTNNSLTHGPIDMLDGSKEKGAAGPPPVRECPECHMVHAIGLKHCPGCNHEYPAGESRINATSNAGAVVSTQSEPLYYNVDHIRARLHTKVDGTRSLRLDYICGLRTVSHWVSLEHETAHGWARKWWEKHSYSGEAPTTVIEALERIDDLRVPGRICVVKDGKFEKVSAWDYSVPPGKTIPVEVGLARPAAYRQGIGSYGHD